MICNPPFSFHRGVWKRLWQNFQFIDLYISRQVYSHIPLTAAHRLNLTQAQCIKIKIWRTGSRHTFWAWISGESPLFNNFFFSRSPSTLEQIRMCESAAFNACHTVTKDLFPLHQIHKRTLLDILYHKAITQ